MGIVHEIVRVALDDEPSILDASHPVEDANAESGVAIEHDVANAGLVASADEDEVATVQAGLHARALDDRVPGRAAELRGCEQEPGSEADDDRDRRGRD